MTSEPSLEDSKGIVQGYYLIARMCAVCNSGSLEFSAGSNQG